MRLLLDTLLLWAAYRPERLSATARALIEDTDNELAFSPASLWEVVIKRQLDRPNFQVEARALRYGLVRNGYIELPITCDHALAVDTLPRHHKDPFDRLIVAQALVEGRSLITADEELRHYPGEIWIV